MSGLESNNPTPVHDATRCMVNKLHDDAITLAAEMRDQIASGLYRPEVNVGNVLDHDGRISHDTLTSLESVRESSAAVARVTAVIAWTLTIKAMYAGELNFSDINRSENRLQCGEVLEGDLESTPDELPAALADTASRSVNVYRRAARLEARLVDAGLHETTPDI